MYRTVLQHCSRGRANLWRTEYCTQSFHLSAPLGRQQKSKKKPASKKIIHRSTKAATELKERPIYRSSRHSLGTHPRTVLYQRLKDYVTQWRLSPRTLRRLVSLGVPPEEANYLLVAFHQHCHHLPSVQLYDDDIVDSLAHTLSAVENTVDVDRAISRIFMDWISLPEFQSLYDTPVSQSALDQLRGIHEATDLSYPAELYPGARAMRRKIIMHVGPTNSGKTHNALRALAAARSGVYAGPLRLLAHEIWERLNKGQIIPLGVEPDKEADVDDANGVDILDGSSKDAPVIQGADPRYARPCNMITGEEIRIVADDALISCTVEMLLSHQLFDVAVIDEIQMISDPDRGAAWTAGLLGLCAKEIHLCGEETAVPLVEKLLQDTGDELVINRYQRLSPLLPGDKALGTYSDVRKGDCIIAFSRKQIYTIKSKIELATGLRCAVAYGRLPPELRSEQAALFNDPNSGYDVMVGSDAIGMGLNLKIKRIIFSTVRKWTGAKEETLSTPQIKQIAGRAGRYGLHGSNEPGIATTLVPTDLPIVKKALEAPIKPLLCAGLPGRETILERLFTVIPSKSATLSFIMDTFEHLCRFNSPYFLPSNQSHPLSTTVLDYHSRDLTSGDLLTWSLAPVQWRDDTTAQLVTSLIQMHKHDMTVSLSKALSAFGLQDELDGVSRCMEIPVDQNPWSQLEDPKKTMEKLETIHRAVVIYMWMNMRNPVIFPEYTKAHEVKVQSEQGMHFVLQALTLQKNGSSHSLLPSLGRKEIEIKYDGMEAVLKRRAGAKR